jgi:medium-chain acyl-[acyl-carrier-protein] hydrolase
MQPLVAALVDAFSPYVDEPFVLFGHSMGAAIAYELAVHFTSIRAAGLRGLIVSSRRAPHTRRKHPEYHTLSDADLAKAICALGGTSARALEDPETSQIVLGRVRADFELLETWSPMRERRLTCPMAGYLGDAEPEVTAELIAEWRHVSTGAFQCAMFPGGHFYLKSAAPAVFDALRVTLASMTGVSGPAPASVPDP